VYAMRPASISADAPSAKRAEYQDCSMPSTVADAGSCLKKVTFNIPAETIDAKFSDSLKALSKQVTLPGFRAGHAPKAVLEKKYGDYIRDDVRRQVMEEALREAATEHGLDLISDPQVDGMPELARGKPLNFELTVEVRPVFDLPEYKGLAIDAREAVVLDSEVDIFVKNMRMSAGSIDPLPEGAMSSEGDVVFGDFSINVGGERVAGRNDGSIEVGSKTLLGVAVDGAENAFASLTPGAFPVEKSFDVTLPADFPLANHAGKAATITVNATGVQRPSYPAIDADFLARIGFESEEAMRKQASEMMKREKDRQVHADISTRLLEQVVSQVKLDIPQQFAERQLANALRNEAFRMYREGATDEHVQAFIEKRRSELPQHIERELRSNFVIDAIAKKERVFVTEDDVSRQVGAMANDRGAQPQAVLKALEENNLIPQLRWDIKAAKVRDLLYKRAKISWIGKPEEKPAA
jgi:trigger factor